ncbi:MAG: acyl-CoA-like ligand-binding transcription factor [Humibacter sp.]
MLFAGEDQLPSALAGALRRVPAETPPFEAMLQAFADLAGVLSERIAEHAQERRTIIASSPELQERSHAKFAAVADALAAGLRERGVDEPTSSLLADVGVAIFRSGFAQWVNAPTESDLARCIRQAGERLTWTPERAG